MAIIKNQDSTVRIHIAFDVRCKNCNNPLSFSEFLMDRGEETYPLTSIGVEPCKHCGKEIEELKNANNN